MGFFDDIGDSNNEMNSGGFFDDIGGDTSLNSGGGFFDDIGTVDSTPTMNNTTKPTIKKKKELTGYQKFDKNLGGFLPWSTKPIDLSEISGSDILNFGKNVGKDLINLPLKFNDAVAEGVTFGGSEKLFDYLTSKLGDDAIKSREEEKKNLESKSFVGNVTEGVGELAGSLIPISKLDKGAELILKKFGQKPATTFAGKVGQAMKRDAIAGAGYGAIDETIAGGDFGDIVGSAIGDAALFGGLGGVLKGVGEWKSLKKPPAPDSIQLNSPESFNEKISWESKTEEPKTWSQKVDNYLTNFVDKFRPAYNLDKDLTNEIRNNIEKDFENGVITRVEADKRQKEFYKIFDRDGLSDADNSFYKQLRLFSGTPESANNFINKSLKPIIDDVQKAGYTVEELAQYSLAKHVKDVNKTLGKDGNPIKSGFTDAEADAIINKYASPEMDLAQQRLVEYNQKLLTNLRDAEIITGDTYEGLIKKYPNYVPLFRDMFDGEKLGVDNLAYNIETNAIANIGKAIYDLKGSGRKVINPLENIIKNTHKISTVTEKNKIMRYFDNRSDYIDLLEKTGKVKRVPKGKESSYPNTVYYYKDDYKIRYNPSTGREEYVLDSLGNRIDEVKKYYVSVSDDLYKMLKDLDAEHSNTLMSNLAKMASTLRAGATLNPAFFVRNPIRDLFSAYVFSKSGFKFFKDWYTGFSEALGKGGDTKLNNYIPDVFTFFVPNSIKNKLYNSKLNINVYKGKGLYDKFLENYGGYGSIISYDRDLQRQAIRELSGTNTLDTRIKDLANDGTVKDYFIFPFRELDIKLLDKLRSYSEITELSTKIGEFNAAKRAGVSDLEAAYRSRDLMDFARSGNITKEINKVISFFNASIQGSSRAYRSFTEDGRFIFNEIKNGQVTGIKSGLKLMNNTSYGKATKAITGFTVAVYLSQKVLANEQQKKVIADSPNWLKSTFWLIPIPGTDTIARIPKPFDLGIIFANIPEKFLNHYFDKQPNAFKNFGIDSVMQLIPSLMITGLMPIIEGMSNYSFFRQGDIIPKREQMLQSKDQFDINTSETAKEIAGILNPIVKNTPIKNFGSPRIIENTIQGYTAGLGKLATDVIDKGLQTTGVVEEKNKPAKKVSELPIINAFTVNTASTGQSMQDLYDLKDKLTKSKNSAKLNKESFKDIGKLSFINSQTDLISNINKQIRDVQNNKKLNPELKRKRMDVLNNKRNDIAIRTMKRLNTWK